MAQFQKQGVTLDVGVRVAGIEGIKEITAQAQEFINNTPLKFAGKQSNKIIIDEIKQTVSVAKQATDEHGILYRKMYDAAASYGAHKLNIKIAKVQTGEDEEGNILSEWQAISVAVSSANQELEKYKNKVQLISSKLSKSSGRPSETKMLQEDYAKVRAEMVTFAEKAAKTTPKGRSQLARDAMRAIKQADKEYAISMENIERNTERSFNKSFETIERVLTKEAKAVAEFQVASQSNIPRDNNPVQLENLRKIAEQAKIEADKTIDIEQRMWADMLKNGQIGSEKYKEMMAKTEADRARISQDQMQQTASRAAIFQENEFKKTLQAINKKKIEIEQATKSLDRLGTKKPETQQWIQASKAQLQILEDNRDAQKEILVSGGKQALVTRMEDEAMADLTATTARFNAQGKGQINIIEDIMSGMKQAAARVINYTLVYRLLWGAIGMGKQAMTIIRELNKSLTDIRMVTGQTASSATSLMQAYSQMGIELGATTGEIANAAIEFLRQGKTISETNQLIKQAMILSKVGAIESAEATEYLTSVINGYEMSVSDAVHVVDAMSQVDIKAATSVKELAIALQQSANSARNAGVSFDTLLGYVGAVSEKTRKSPETIGQAFKTMFARMQNIKVGKFVDDETDEPLNDVEKALGKLGIALRTIDGQWRSSSSVLDDLNSKWAILTQTEKNAAAVALGGVRQREILLALMDSYDRAMVLEAEAINSSGAAAKKYASYLESIGAKQNKLRATAEKMIFTDFTQSAYELIMLDIPQTFLDIANAIGLLNAAITLGGFLGAIAVVDQLSKAYIVLQKSMSFYLTANKSVDFVKMFNEQYLGAMKMANANQLLNVQVLANSAASKVYNMAQLKRILIDAQVDAGIITQIMGMQGLEFATVKVTGAIGFLKLALNSLKAAIVAHPFIALATAVFLAFQAFEYFDESLAERAKKIENLTTTISDLIAEYDKLSKKSGLTEFDKTYMAILERKIQLNKDLLKVQQEEQHSAKYTSGVVGNPKTNEPTNVIRKEVGNWGPLKWFEDIDPNLAKLKDLYAALKNLPTDSAGVEVWDKNRDALTKLEGTVADTVAELIAFREAGVKLTKDEELLITNYQALTAENKNFMASINSTKDSYETLNAVLTNSRLVSSKLKEEVAKLTSVYDEMNSNGSLSSATVLDLIANNSDLVDIITIENGQYKISASALQLKFEAQKLAAIASLNAQKASLGNVTALELERDAYLRNAAAAGGDAKAKMLAMAATATSNISDIRAAIAIIDKQLALITGMSWSGFTASTKTATSAADKLNDKLKEQQDLLDKLEKRYSAFKNAVLKLLEKEKKALEDQKTAIEENYDAQIKVLQDQLDAMDKQADEADRLLAIEEARLAVAKAEKALADALQQKNTRVYTAEAGWTWTSDPEAVQNAQDNLDESKTSLQKLLDDWNFDQAKAQLQAAIDALEAAKVAAVKIIDDQITKLDELSDKWTDSMDIEEDLSQYAGLLELLAKFESASYEERLGMLTQFADDWERESSRINDAIVQTQAKIDANGNGGGGGNGTPPGETAAEKAARLKKEAADALAAQRAAGKTQWNKLVESAKMNEIKGFYDLLGADLRALDKLYNSDITFYSAGYDAKATGRKKYKSFKDGGPVTYTGMAAVHGTDSKNEWMLNARELPVVKNLFSKMGVNYQSSMLRPQNANGAQATNYMVYGDINVQADSQDTLDTVLQSALSYSKSGKG